MPRHNTDIVICPINDWWENIKHRVASGYLVADITMNDDNVCTLLIKI